MTSVTTERHHGPRTGLSRAGLLTVLGAIAGLLLGLVVTGAVVIWGLSQMADRQPGTLDLAPVIELTKAPSGDVTAHSGNGIVLLPALGLLIGAVTGWLLGRARG